MPSTLFVESCGAFVSNRAGEPGGGNAACSEPGLRIGNQCGRDARTSCLRRDEELIELVPLDDGESNRGAQGAYDSHIGKCGTEPVSETLQRPKSNQFRRHDLRMRFLPAVEPHSCQALDLCFFSGSHIHFSVRGTIARPPLREAPCLLRRESHECRCCGSAPPIRASATRSSRLATPVAPDRRSCRVPALRRSACR